MCTIIGEFCAKNHCGEMAELAGSSDCTIRLFYSTEWPNLFFVWGGTYQIEVISTSFLSRQL